MLEPATHIHAVFARTRREVASAFVQPARLNRGDQVGRLDPRQNRWQRNLFELRARLDEISDGRLRDPAYFWIHIDPKVFLRTRQTQALSLRRTPKILLPASQACGVQRVASRDAFQYERRVQGASRNGPHMIETRRQRKDTMDADAPKCGLKTYNAAQRGWNADGSASIAADGRRT